MSNNNDNSNIPSKPTTTSFREVRLSKYYVKVLIDNLPDVLGTPSESINLLSLKSYMGDKCKTYVEIGTLWGGSIISLMNLNDNYT